MHHPVIVADDRGAASLEWRQMQRGPGRIEEMRVTIERERQLKESDNRGKVKWGERKREKGERAKQRDREREGGGGRGRETERERGERTLVRREVRAYQSAHDTTRHTHIRQAEATRATETKERENATERTERNENAAPLARGRAKQRVKSGLRAAVAAASNTQAPTRCAPIEGLFYLQRTLRFFLFFLLDAIID
jgi:hypothetical protein